MRGAAPIAGRRLVFLCGQDVALNERIAVPAGAALAHVPLRDDLGASDAPGPFSLADPGRIVDMLNQAGSTDMTMAPVEGALRLVEGAAVKPPNRPQMSGH